MSSSDSGRIDQGNCQVKFHLLKSSAFIRAAKKVVKRNPQILKDLRKTLMTLSQEPFHPQLKTHKLNGDLQDCSACSIDHSLRIIFRFTEYRDNQAILLESIGSHDEVY